MSRKHCSNLDRSIPWPKPPIIPTKEEADKIKREHEAQSEADRKMREYQSQVSEVLDWAKQHGATVKFVFSTGRYTISLNTLSVEASSLYEAYQAISKKVLA